MKFVLPCEEYEERAKAFIEEFIENNSEINGTGGLNSYLERADYNQWLEKVRRDLDLANVSADRVPAYTYFYVDENRETGEEEIVGMINIRLELNEFLLHEGGHIGYCVRPSRRRNGYATRMLKETQRFLKRIGLNRILITCDQENRASAGVILNCGGILENECYSETFGTVIQRYWIEI